MKDNNATITNDTGNGESSASSGRIDSRNSNNSSSSSKYKNSIGYNSTEVNGILITAIAKRLGVDIILSETNRQINTFKH